MKQFLSILIIIGLGLSIGVPIKSAEVKPMCFAGKELKCPMSGKLLSGNASPFSCPKTGNNSKCQKKFFNLINTFKIDIKLDVDLFSNLEFISEKLTIIQNSDILARLIAPPDDPDPPGNLPLLI